MADELMRSDQYKDKPYTQFYQGLVSSDDGEQGLVFAHPGNISKLNEETKTLQTDGTFRYSFDEANVDFCLANVWHINLN